MSSRRPRRKPGVNRELLIEAGLREFGLRGYHGTSTATIAMRANVPQPHLYASFKTKQELFVVCLERAGSLAAEGPSSSDSILAKFLFQAVAAAGDPKFSTIVSPVINAILQELGELGFRDLLLLAASSLLSGEGPATSLTE